MPHLLRNFLLPSYFELSTCVHITKVWYLSVHDSWTIGDQLQPAASDTVTRLIYRITWGVLGVKFYLMKKCFKSMA